MNLTAISHLPIQDIEMSQHIAELDFVAGNTTCPFELNSPESVVWESTVNELRTTTSVNH